MPFQINNPPRRPTGVTPGTYGDAGDVGQFTVNQYGELTAASSVGITGGGGGGTAIQPDDSSVLSELFAWWKGGGITGLSDGGALSAWPDSSSNGYDLGLGASGAIYKASVVNSLPVARFNGAGWLKTSVTTPFNLGAFTVICVHGSTSGTLFGKCDALASDGSRRKFYFEAAGWLQGTDSAYLGPPMNYNSWSLSHLSIGSNGGLPQIGVNGLTINAYGGATFDTNGTNNSQPFCVGNGFANSPANYLTGDIAEIVIYNAQLSSSVLASILLGLANKYAIARLL